MRLAALEHIVCGVAPTCRTPATPLVNALARWTSDSADPIERTDAEFGLEILDLARERGLAYVHAECCLRDATHPGDTHEAAQMPKFHPSNQYSVGIVHVQPVASRDRRVVRHCADGADLAGPTLGRALNGAFGANGTREA